jgi:hypothetical protein
VAYGYIEELEKTNFNQKQLTGHVRDGGAHDGRGWFRTMRKRNPNIKEDLLSTRRKKKRF